MPSFYSCIDHVVRPNSLLENASLLKSFFTEFENVFMRLTTYFFCYHKRHNIQNLFQKLSSKIWDTSFVIPVFTALILLLLFPIIKIRQYFFFFLTATNALTTCWVTFSEIASYSLCLSYFLVWFSHDRLMEINSTHVSFRSRILMSCYDNKKRNTFKDNSQSEYFIY